jgi:hypothetical protein
MQMKVSGTFNRRYRKAHGTIRGQVFYKPRKLDCKTFTQEWQVKKKRKRH